MRSVLKMLKVYLYGTSYGRYHNVGPLLVCFTSVWVVLDDVWAKTKTNEGEALNFGNPNL